jgi:hypothetical protein
VTTTALHERANLGSDLIVVHSVLQRFESIGSSRLTVVHISHRLCRVAHTILPNLPNLTIEKSQLHYIQVMGGRDESH